MQSVYQVPGGINNLILIKQMVMEHGGATVGVCTEQKYWKNKKRNLYSELYGEPVKTADHETLIIGWDDEYPASNFSITPKGDGAWICKNSWGEDFGDGGYIYISYDDVNIGNQDIVYTRLADSDNFDNIYQSDILGWVGQMGFSKESAYFANVYTAEKDEVLKAISFYATGDDTSFTVFVVTDYKDDKSLNSGRKEIGKGETRYAGYYTVDLSQDIELTKGQKYAVIVKINTPGSEKPIAIECDAGSRTGELDLSDGEGYMSLYGEKWHRAEDADANICLKAFTDDR